MLGKFVRVVMTCALLVLVLSATFVTAQQPVPEARPKDRLFGGFSTELYFSSDGGKLFALRHLGSKNEPLITTYRTSPFLNPLYPPLVGINIFGKAEIESEQFSPFIANFRTEQVQMVLSPDNRCFLTTSFHTMRLWNTAKGTPIGPAREHSGNVMAAFTKDGKRILTMSIISP